MSHTVKVKDIKLTNTSALEQAASRLGISVQRPSGQKLYDGTVAREGVVLQIPGWHYPILVDAKGEASYDNYGGEWGNEDDLTQLLKNYNAMCVFDALTADGWICTETTMANGDIVIETEDQEMFG